MDLFDKIYTLHHMLQTRRYPVSRKEIESHLECSRATAKRVIAHMRDYLNAPIIYQTEPPGYIYDRQENPKFELPGLWFTGNDLHALLSLQHLLREIKPGLLDDLLQPVKKRIEAILNSKYLEQAPLAGKIKILGMAMRRGEQDHFKIIAAAVLKRRQLRITYHSRSQDEVTERVVSPQHLVHYRDNWYLDAWDHGKKAMRSERLPPKKVSSLRTLSRTII